MPPPSSSLSIVCDHIRDFIRTGIDGITNSIEVSIGSPAGVTSEDSHLLNLFFYRFEPSGFEAGAQPDHAWRLRMFCMITPFAVDEPDGGSTISAGENDMRILGEVIRVLHETPVLPAVEADGVAVRTRAVFMSTSDEQINQIWSTQGDTHYRPSAVYEMSLTPIVPNELAAPHRLVGAVGAQARSGADRHTAFSGVASGPPVHAQSVDIGDRAWTPATALIHDDALHRSLALDVDSAEFAAFTPQVWLAGDPAETVQLVWEAWRPAGWQASGAPQPAQPFGISIDPDAIPTAPLFPIDAPLPETLDPADQSLQLLLFAERSFSRFDGGPTETARSAPLLITLYRS